MQSPVPMEFRRLCLRFDAPVLMGILNITPDSFSDGGQFSTVAQVLTRAEAMVAAGATILDVGGESTRPGAVPVDAEDEKQRVLPILEALAHQDWPVVLSVDTRKASVAREALAAGAEIINDVSALGDPEMAGVVVEADASIVLMHMRGAPQSMQEGEIAYDEVVDDVCSALAAACDRFVAAGGDPRRVMFDPGIGFGKTLEHNLTLTRGLGRLAELGGPVVYGPSRKAFLGELTGHSDPKERDIATAAVCAIGVLAGAHILRVHNVAAVRDAVAVAAALS